MAASSSTQAAVPLPDAPPQTGVHELPDDLLVQILGALNVKERQRAALVCRRWNGCVNSPELCSDVDLKIYLSVSGIDYWSKPLPEDLPSFAAWLERHGQHVRRLSLSAGSSNHDGAMMRQMAECWPAAVAAMPQLRQLHLEWMAGSLLEIGWLGQLAASLRELGLYASGYEQGLELASSLGGLTQLTKLMLAAGWVLVLNEGVQLPPSLRTLALNGRGEDQPVTGQLPTLTGLDTLVLGYQSTMPEDACLSTALGQLTYLEHERLALPEWIPGLPKLQHLVLHSRWWDERFWESAFVRQLNTGLPHLTGLTALLLVDSGPLRGIVPAALAQLPRLQRLCFLIHDGPLPLGPYSASLRVLGASAKCLHRSTALLASCDGLEHVAVLRGNCNRPGPLWQWAAQHPPLRRLLACHTPDPKPRSQTSDSEDGEPAEPQVVAWLREVRPELEVESNGYDSFLALFKWQDRFWNDTMAY